MKILHRFEKALLKQHILKIPNIKHKKRKLIAKFPINIIC